MGGVRVNGGDESEGIWLIGFIYIYEIELIKKRLVITLNRVGKELCWGDGWGRSKECKMEGYSELAKLIPMA
jgi:hypothetical protein